MFNILLFQIMFQPFHSNPRMTRMTRNDELDDSSGSDDETGKKGLALEYTCHFKLNGITYM